MAPHCDAAVRAARDLLAVAAVGRRVDQLGRIAEHADAIHLDHRVERERRTGLALAPAAVAAMDEQRPRLHAVAHALAIAAAFEREWIGSGHAMEPLRVQSSVRAFRVPTRPMPPAWVARQVCWATRRPGRAGCRASR